MPLTETAIKNLKSKDKHTALPMKRVCVWRSPHSVGNSGG